MVREVWGFSWWCVCDFFCVRVELVEKSLWEFKKVRIVWKLLVFVVVGSGFDDSLSGGLRIFVMMYYICDYFLIGLD